MSPLLLVRVRTLVIMRVRMHTLVNKIFDDRLSPRLKARIKRSQS